MIVIILMTRADKRKSEYSCDRTAMVVVCDRILFT